MSCSTESNATEDVDTHDATIEEASPTQETAAVSVIREAVRAIDDDVLTPRYEADLQILSAALQQQLQGKRIEASFVVLSEPTSEYTGNDALPYRVKIYLALEPGPITGDLVADEVESCLEDLWSEGDDVVVSLLQYLPLTFYEAGQSWFVASESEEYTFTRTARDIHALMNLKPFDVVRATAVITGARLNGIEFLSERRWVLPYQRGCGRYASIRMTDVRISDYAAPRSVSRRHLEQLIDLFAGK